MRRFRVKRPGRRARIRTLSEVVRILAKLKGPVTITRYIHPRTRIVRAAEKYLGVRENPRGSNSGTLIDAWLKASGSTTPNPWCAAFASCVVAEAGFPLKGGPSASCRTLRERANTLGRWTQNPKRGYLGIVKGDKHIVIVEKVAADGTIHDISGNTSASDGSSYNGGEVARHTHQRAAFSGFIRTY